MSFQVISTSIIQARNHSQEWTHENIDLTPWDLIYLKIEPIQQGLLFHKPNNTSTTQTIDHLKNTLSSTLSFFPPLAGRLVITHHQNDNTSSCFIHCNNAGASFVHVVADSNITVADILKLGFVPSNIVHPLFPLNDVKNYEGTSCSLLAVQVTELVDGIFIGCAINHVVADGKSFWHFINSWAELSRGEEKITKLPSFQRWFLNDIEFDRPIRFPSFANEEKENQQRDQVKLPPNRIFHFSKEKIARLKSIANEKVGIVSGETEFEISSLQALLAHIWSSAIANQSDVDPQSETRCMLTIDVRSRMCPKLEEGYFGNALRIGFVRMKVGELVMEGGIGKCALEMNKLVRLEGDGENIKANYKSWLKNPFMGTCSGAFSRNTKFVISSSPRFDFYGNDFGWGKPLAIRNGAGKRCGKITVFGGIEEGSVDVEVCFPYDILQAMGNDPIFMDDDDVVPI